MRARVISRRRRSPPERVLAFFLASFSRWSSCRSFSRRLVRSAGFDRESLEDAEDVFFNGELAEDRRLLGEVSHAEVRALMDGEVRHVSAL